jgi:hypothetical protein
MQLVRAQGAGVGGLKFFLRFSISDLRVRQLPRGNDKNWLPQETWLPLETTLNSSPPTCSKGTR